MKRSKAYFRYQRSRTLRRKLGILKRRGTDDYDSVTAWTRGEPGRLAKGKIHCSCWMCRTKSYDDLRIRDKRNALTAEQKIWEFYRGEEA